MGAQCLVGTYCSLSIKSEHLLVTPNSERARELTPPVEALGKLTAIYIGTQSSKRNMCTTATWHFLAKFFILNQDSCPNSLSLNTVLYDFCHYDEVWGGVVGYLQVLQARFLPRCGNQSLCPSAKGKCPAPDSLALNTQERTEHLSKDTDAPLQEKLYEKCT